MVLCCRVGIQFVDHSVECSGCSLAAIEFSWFGKGVLIQPGLNKPTGPVKPTRSSSGLPDRFDRKPVETGQIQNQIQNRMF